MAQSEPDHVGPCKAASESGFYSKGHGKTLNAIKWGGKGDMVRLAFLLELSGCWVGNQ